MDFAGAFAWIIAHGYWLMFLAMLIEGPIVTSAAAFAAALGYFNIYAVFLVSMAGDLGGDIFFYTIGYFSKYALLGGFGRLIGLKPERVERFQNLLASHAGKIILAIKLTPIAPPAGLALVGASHYSVKKFALLSLAVSLPKTIVFLVIGFFFGAIYSQLAPYINYGGYVIFGGVILFIVIYMLYKRWSRKLVNKIDSDDIV